MHTRMHTLMHRQMHARRCVHVRSRTYEQAHAPIRTQAPTCMSMPMYTSYACPRPHTRTGTP